MHTLKINLLFPQGQDIVDVTVGEVKTSDIVSRTPNKFGESQKF